MKQIWRSVLLLACLGVTLLWSPRPRASSAAQRAPNILVIVTDDQRAFPMKPMDATRKLFGRGGTRFTQTHTPIPLCCPARATLFSGRYPHNHGVRTNSDAHELDQRATFQRYLSESGYRTAISGKYLNSWDVSQPPPYFDRWSFLTRGRAGGSDGYRDVIFNVEGNVETTERYSTSFIRQRAIRYLRWFEQTDEEPWFLYVAPVAPHGPPRPQARYATADAPSWRGNPAVFENDRSDKPPAVTNLGPGSRWHWNYRRARRFRAAQLRTLMSVDDLVERVFGELRSLGESRDTLAVFTSDNGVFWGEHGLSLKGMPYVQATRVPLYLRWPGHIERETADDRLVGLQDLAPTILDAAGLQPDDELPMDGRSLFTDYRRDHLLIEHWFGPSPRGIPTWAGLLAPRDHQYVEYYDEQDQRTFVEYYDLVLDPWQLDNLGDPSDPRQQTLSARLQTERRCAGETCP